MREIKFRAWDKRTNKMLTVDYIEWSDYLAYPNSVGAKEWDDFITYPDFELMQYTGLKDKNGKEGYHKDIVIDDLSRYFVIEWNEEDGKWFLQPVDRGHKSIFYSDILQEISNLKFLGIIGNIYENKELLNAK